MISFGERLKKARKRRGLTQAQVMEMTGITDKSLSRYENGASAPDPDSIPALIRLYDVSADYIMGLSTQMGHATVSPSDGLTVSGGCSDVYEMLEELSDGARKKAEEYIVMLKTLDGIKAAGMPCDNEKREHAVPCG